MISFDKIRIAPGGSQYILSSDVIRGSRSRIARREVDDCVVRAVAVAFGTSYKVAHSWTKGELSRKHKEGVEHFEEKMNKKARTGEVIFRQQLKHLPIRMRVGTFLKKFKEGSYILSTPGHVFSVVEGIIIGEKEDGEKLRTLITSAYKVI